MAARLLRQLLPGTCLMCGSLLPADFELDLCRYCRDALPHNEPACPRCALPLPATAPAVPENPLCPRCRQRPPPFSLTVAPLLYEGFPRVWVSRLKDKLGMVEGRTLALLLARAAARRYATLAAAERPDMIVPVPLTRLRLARRGHNQALTLARPLARRLAIPVAPGLTVRRRRGRRQRGLSRRQRLDNPSGLFACRHHWPDGGPCVAIVDDVMTTGATAAELARVLLAAGARDVHVLCPTRTAPAGSIITPPG